MPRKMVFILRPAHTGVTMWAGIHLTNNLTHNLNFVEKKLKRKKESITSIIYENKISSGRKFGHVIAAELCKITPD